MKQVKGFLLSLGITTLSSMAVLGVAALVIGKTGTLPQGQVVTVLVTLAVCLAVFLGGLSASLFTGEKGILMGGACGLFFACGIAAVSLIAFDSLLTIGGGARLAAVFLSGCVGGVLGVNRKKVKF